MEIIKRNGERVPFESQKIVTAILSANGDVKEEFRVSDRVARNIARDITNKAKETPLNVEEVQDLVEESLAKRGAIQLARAYIKFRHQRELIRKANSTDDTILELVRNENKELNEENSNKNPTLASTERDCIAGIVSRDLTYRLLLPDDVVKAHENGVIHFHDSDYFVQHIFNCCLIDIRDILNNGTVMHGKLIEPPKSFQVACTVMTQVIAAVASNQYGGQSVAIKHLGKFLRISREKFEAEEREMIESSGGISFESREALENYIKVSVDSRVRKELAAGVQTIQYQINTLMTTNGQSPFVTLFMELDENDPYLEETASIIEEILRQRLEGIKNEVGVRVTPAFPKLVYVLDECNCLKGGKYDYLTRLAVKCSAKRMYPDYISAKKMRENYQGQVFSCMGCRSFLAPWKDENGNYKFEGRFNQGVVSLNLPQIGILAKGNQELFWELLEERLAIAFKALMCRHKALEGTTSDVSPIHWQFGAIARLKKGEKIDKFLHGSYSSISLGYIGLYELTKLMTGVSHTTPEGTKFALAVMHRLREAVDSWKESTGIGFALYGTPAESLCYRFAETDRKKFGDIKDVTDKGYYTNSYHVDVREKIDAFEKLKFESQFQDISSGGAISYVEVPNLEKNLAALEAVVKFIYDNIQYAEFNTKSDYCHVCGFSGEIIINSENEWECPQCGNKDHRFMTVIRRTCGYLGENFWNVGKTKEMAHRVTHL